MNRISGVFPLMLSIALTSQAHDLKAALQDLGPAGEIMRLVYAKGGKPQEDNGWGNFNFPGTAIYGVCSDSGIIRKIYPAGSGTGNYHCINITNDGTRIVFWDAAANQIVVVNWNGTGARTITPANYSATGMYDYYYDAATKTEWAILSNDDNFVKVNIDRPNDAPVTVATSAQVGSWYPADDIGGTISDDGKYMVADNGSGTKGLLDLTKSSRTFITGRSGCHVIMRSGTPVQFSQNVGGGSGNCTTDGVDFHRGPNVFGVTGNAGGIVEYHCVSDAVNSFIGSNPSMNLSGCTFEDRADGLRWLRNRNYFSGMVYGNFGPTLWRTTDKKWTYVEHDIPCSNANASEAFYKNIYIGDMDGQTAASFSGTPTAIMDRLSRPAHRVRQAEEIRTFSVDGRRLVPGPKAEFRTRLVIGQLEDGTVAALLR